MFFGWWVVGAAFLLAVWSSGFGLYGLSIYVVALRQEHAWSTSTVSFAITAYYLIGALLMAGLGAAIRRFGPRLIVQVGIIAMAAGVLGLTWLTTVWQLYLALALMALGWATTSSAAINILLAPWFDKRRGLAVSLALTGAHCGGFTVAPLLVVLIGSLGFRVGVGLALGGLLALLLPFATIVVGRTPAQIGWAPDGGPARIPGAQNHGRSSLVPSPGTGQRGRAGALRRLRYWTLSLAFAAALTAQIGMLTHFVAYLTPIRGAMGAALALSITTVAALAGRLALGIFVDRLPLRALASLVFIVQAAGLALLTLAANAPALFAGCIAFGFGIGNVVTLPGLLVQREYPAEEFAGILSLVAATNQITFAFGPGMLGALRDWTGGYGSALGLAVALDVTAAVLILLGTGERRFGKGALRRS